MSAGQSSQSRVWFSSDSEDSDAIVDLCEPASPSAPKPRDASRVAPIAAPKAASRDSQKASWKASLKASPTNPKSWSCSMCTLLNDEAHDKCTVCDTPAPGKAQSGQQKAAQSVRIPPSPDAKGGWKCDKCTFLNQRNAYNCVICQIGERPGEVSPAPTPSSSSSSSSSSRPLPPNPPLPFISPLSPPLPAEPPRTVAVAPQESRKKRSSSGAKLPNGTKPSKPAAHAAKLRKPRKKKRSLLSQDSIEEDDGDIVAEQANKRKKEAAPPSRVGSSVINASARSRATAVKEVVCLVDASLQARASSFSGRLVEAMQQEKQLVQWAESVGCALSVRWKRSVQVREEWFPNALLWVPGKDFVRLGDDGSLVPYAEACYDSLLSAQKSGGDAAAGGEGLRLTIISDGVFSLVQNRRSKLLRLQERAAGSGERAEAADYKLVDLPSVDALVSQAWFKSVGKLRFKLVDSEADVVNYVVSISKSLAKALVRPEDNPLTLVQTRRKSAMRGGDEIGVKRKFMSPGETWQAFLMQIPGMSLQKAAAVTKEFASFRSLMEAFEGCSSDKEKQKLLQNLKVGVIPNQPKSGRNLGPAASGKIVRFMQFSSADNPRAQAKFAPADHSGDAMGFQADRPS